MFGYEFSGTEYTLIFENDNIGFVRFDNRSRKKFYLDPSPFLKSPKQEVYVLEGENAPKNGDLVEIFVSETDSLIQGSIHNCTRTKIKYVRDWKKLSPNTYIRSKAMKPDEYTDFFGQPFHGIHEYNVEDLSFCMALCTVSSPILGSNGKGGIDTGIFGKKNAWDSYKTLMDVIPSDFKKVKSKYYYNQADKDVQGNPIQPKEVNLSVLSPHTTSIHLPILVDTEVRDKSKYKDNVLYQIPIMRAYMLDTLLFEPEPASEKVEKELIDMIYSILDEVNSTKSIAYDLDIGSTAAKLSSAFARLKLKESFTETDVRECGETWREMYHRSLKLSRVGMRPEDLFRLSPEEFRLYQELQDACDLEKQIPMSVLETVKSLNPLSLDNAFQGLRKKGLLYCPTGETIRLIDFKM